MNRNQALELINRLHALHGRMEKCAMKLEKAVVPLKKNALGHSTRILVGIVAGIRRYLISNEEEIVNILMKGESANGKEIQEDGHKETRLDL